MTAGPPLLSGPGLAGLNRVAHAFETRDTRLTAELPSPVLRLRQVHGDLVHRIDETTDLGPYLHDRVEDRPAGDALVSVRPGVTVAVATADCVPILIASEQGVAAAVHAGWRGLACGILRRTLAAISDCGIDAATLRAAIGPCAGPLSYEVSDEVRDAFLAAGLPGALFEPTRPGHWLCDLAAAAEWQLRRGGVALVERLERCTVREDRWFHSWRRDGASAGRMLSGIALLR